ncbi:AraC family transcriptional regulator [uncultured Cohaesibacter sp.]|uniref:AraC family transcriptional regulator n=1 Tax=uncultured Cohaesibacter sp. TaxID=1002546 RepID=UPI0029C91167|nr:AraC family transcriptional regulator [uncultured Cohaesibacter sp.]
MNKHNDKPSIAELIGSNARFAFGETAYHAGEIFGPMKGYQLEAIYLRVGQVEVRCDDTVFAMEAPQVALIASRERLEYRYGPANLSNVLWCQYLSDQLDSHTYGYLSRGCGPLDVSPASVSLLKIGADLPTEFESGMEDMCSALGIAVMENLMMRRQTLDTAGRIPPQVQLVRRYIEDHLASPITMKLLAELSGLSPQHLNRLYQAAYDENPLDCLWRLRVRRGAHLLSHTGKQISQIAYEVGFKTPNHFSRQIKSAYGLSPRRLRAESWSRRTN